MLTEKEIKAKYKKLHDDFSQAYYSGTSGLTKEEFDLQHGQIWSDMEAELITEGYRKPFEPPRDLATEVDEITAKIADYDDLKARVGKLEGK